MKARIVISSLCLGLCCGPGFAQHLLMAADVSGAMPLPAAFFEPDPRLLSSVLSLPDARIAPPSRIAIKSVFTRDNMVTMARNFVPGQPLPDGPTYIPLSRTQKWELFLRNSHSTSQFAGVAFDSLISQATGAFPAFGGGIAGYDKRFAVTLAGAESATFFGGFLLPTLLHQDPRYFPSRSHTTSNRFAYAVSRVIIGRSDSGRNVFNTSGIASDFIEAAFANAYVPYRHPCMAGTLENGLAGLEWAAESNILNEFDPTLRLFWDATSPDCCTAG